MWAAAGGALASGSTTGGLVLVGAATLDAGLCWWFRRIQPVGYRISRDAVVIERRAAADRVVAGGVGQPRRARLGLRLFGSGGLYGYLGVFRLPGGGRVTAYVTDLSRVVVIRAGKQELALSPAEPDALVSAVTSDA